MSSSRSIKCDNCDKELIVDSQYPAKYTLELSCINTGINTANSQYAVYIVPPIEQTMHFCNITCLAAWASGKDK